jgi:hypothetical protein
MNRTAVLAEAKLLLKPSEFGHQFSVLLLQQSLGHNTVRAVTSSLPQIER